MAIYYGGYIMPAIRYLPLAALLLASPTLLFTACATGPEIPSVPELLSNNTGQDGRACVRVSDIRGYGVNNGGFINIDGTRGYYVATVNPGCTDLGTSPQLLFQGHFTEMCGGRMDKITTRENQCTIRAIFEFESRDAALEAYEKAKKQRDALEATAAD